MNEEQRSDEDKRLHVTFYSAPKLNKGKSEQAGRPIYEDVEKVKIRIPGERLTVIGGLAHDKTRKNRDTGLWMSAAERFPKQYEAFKQGQEQIGAGTPLDVVPWLSKAKAAELKALHIYTVEALAEINKETIGRIGKEGHQLQKKARAYIDTAASSADVIRLGDENDALKARLEALEKQMNSGTVPASPEVTPFDDWADEDVANWMTDQGRTPDKRWSRETLLAKAVEVNAEISKIKKAS